MKIIDRTLSTASSSVVASNLRRALMLSFVLAGALPSWAAEPIVIGRSLALSGPLQTYGEDKRDGGDAYIEQVNKAGGIGGRLIKLVTLDDHYQPEMVVANLNRIASTSQPVAFLGLFGVPTVSAALPVLQELKIPAVGLTSGTESVRVPFNPYSFPVRASYADEARKLVAHVKTIGIKKIAVIYTENAFGRSVKDTLVDTFKANGIQPITYQLDPAGRFSEDVVNKAMASKPQGIFLTMLSLPAHPVITELKKAGLGTFVYAFSPVDTTLMVKQLGSRAAGLNVSQIVPIPTSRNFNLTTQYSADMKALGRGAPSFYGLEAYLEAKVLVEGLRRAGPNTNSAGLVKSLESMQDWDAGGLHITYKPGQHSGANFVEIDGIDDAGVLRR